MYIFKDFGICLICKHKFYFVKKQAKVAETMTILVKKLVFTTLRKWKKDDLNPHFDFEEKFRIRVGTIIA